MILELGTDPEPELHEWVAKYSRGEASWNEVLTFVNHLLQKTQPTSLAPVTPPLALCCHNTVNQIITYCLAQAARWNPYPKEPEGDCDIMHARFQARAQMATEIASALRYLDYGKSNTPATEPIDPGF